MRAIYSRNRIVLGDESFQPNVGNVGVVQGSIVSPYLFNIYAEDLLNDLHDEAGVYEIFTTMLMIT